MLAEQLSTNFFIKLLPHLIKLKSRDDGELNYNSSLKVSTVYVYIVFDGYWGERAAGHFIVNHKPKLP